MHTDELGYVFGIPLLIENFTEDDKQFSEFIITYWTNFAKYG